MKLFTALFLVVSFLIGTAFSPPDKKLPDVNVKTLEGKTVNIQDFANNGKITIISFWATWCSPCKKELDAIADLYKEWQDEYNVELVAITIDNARGLAKVKPMVNQKQWDYIILSDVKQELQKALNFQTVPQTFVLDLEGNIVFSHTGYVPGDEYELEDVIKKLAG